MDWDLFRHHKHQPPKPDPELDELKQIEHTDQRIEDDLDLLVNAELHLPSAMAITQISSPIGGFIMSVPTPTILGITLGNTGVFQEVVTAPTGAAFPPNTTFKWTSDDALTTLTPSTDTTQVAIATTTGDTATSFNLTCTSSFTPPGASAPLSATANVPLNPAVVTPPTPSAMAINQLS